MATKKQPRSNDVVVDLKELEWVKVLEISVPQDLVWLAAINMLHPVQFDRMELGLLIYCLREHALTVKQPRSRAALERIADKMQEAMQTPPPNPPPPSQVPNNKQTALELMQQDLQAMLNNPARNDRSRKDRNPQSSN